MIKAVTHTPVLLKEAVDALDVQPNNWYIDATLGSGGHTSEIISRGGNVLAFDWDSEVLEFSQVELQKEVQEGHLRIIHENFTQLINVINADHQDISDNILGILFDFGTNSSQLKSTDRGFSFEGDGVLDMRMDKRMGVMAKDILAVVPEGQLAQLFIQEGGESYGKVIAKAIKSSPEPISTTKQLSEIVMKVKRSKRGRIHPATKVFQALRVAVNSEISNIEEALPQAYSLLQPGGKIVTISFHEGEDRVAKVTMKNWEAKSLGVMENKSVITPSESEVSKNPRSRSAKMRIFRKKNNK